MSIGTTMLFIHSGAFDESTCHGMKPHVGCGFLGWKHGWLLLLPSVGSQVHFVQSNWLVASI
jgi:hypothetical protein